MGLLYVDEEKCGTIPVLLIQRLEVAGPATEGRSRKASEDEDERPACLVRTSCDRLLAVEHQEGEVRRRQADCGNRSRHQTPGAFPILRALFSRGSVHPRNELSSRIDGAATGSDQKENRHECERAGAKLHKLFFGSRFAGSTQLVSAGIGCLIRSSASDSANFSLSDHNP